ncbi:MAG: pentapeptide repeat-containing protein [Lachnospiraceae bacterium]|nr:pentapeptide repeat-containing protein [Lachnospiraceae bacterium]
MKSWGNVQAAFIGTPSVVSSGLLFAGISFTGISFTGISFTGTSFTGTSFAGTLFTGTTFYRNRNSGFYTDCELLSFFGVDF